MSGPPKYCPYFCEENVWHLCADEGAVPAPVDERRVLFVSNARRQVLMRRQRAGGEGPVVWDYHVVLLAGGRIWDLDSTLGFGVELGRWLRESFPPVDPDRAPRFRVIDAPTYLKTFASDRSHMKGPDGRPLKPLPPWPPIGSGTNLLRFVDVESPFVGDCLDLDAVLRRFGT
jgi:hypothetical protein